MRYVAVAALLVCSTLTAADPVPGLYEWMGKDVIDKVGKLPQLADRRDIPWGKPGVKIQFNGYTQVFQIIDDSSAIFDSYELGMHLVSNLDTSRLTDGKKLKLDVPVEVDENYTYTMTTGASRTIGHLKILDKAPERPVPFLRTWTNAKHGSKAKAAFYGFSRGTVELMKPDRTIVKIRKSMLSDADQDRVLELVRLGLANADFTKEVLDMVKLGADLDIYFDPDKMPGEVLEDQD